MIINETQMFGLLDSSNNVILIEPNYVRQYVPLGLAKISAYLKSKEKSIAFLREYNGEDCDLICVTTLFTYESKIVSKCLDEIKEKNNKAKVLVGGIFASIMPKFFENKYPDFYIFTGYSRILDQIYPDYEMEFNPLDRWRDYFNIFTTRGCPNKCPYCAVWRIEDRIQPWINPKWKEFILSTTKSRIMISDNNLNTAPKEHLMDVLETLANTKKYIKFNNGLDIKHIDDDIAEAVGKLKIEPSGLAIAFDRIEEDGIFQDAVERLHKFGVNKSAIMTYVLFNFIDTPQEAHYRAHEAFRLKTRPYPMRYASLRALDRRENMFIGKHWTFRLTTTFRHYWLFGGCHNHMTFEEAVNSGKFRQMKMDAESWEKWNIDKGKYKI